jgi:hypothetical protein
MKTNMNNKIIVWINVSSYISIPFRYEIQEQGVKEF